jgi:hypothetical protein
MLSRTSSALDFALPYLRLADYLARVFIISQSNELCMPEMIRSGQLKPRLERREMIERIRLSNAPCCTAGFSGGLDA